MGSLGETVKKYNTDLTDYSTVHTDKTGPYAENLEVDALVVGAGFGKSPSLTGCIHQLTRYSRCLHAQDPPRSRPEDSHFRGR